VAVAELTHVPPAVALVNVMVAPAFTEDAPVIVPATGNGLTLTILKADELPHSLPTV
jgi:hypothetical protein